jgi:hypothetical protein
VRFGAADAHAAPATRASGTQEHRSRQLPFVESELPMTIHITPDDMRSTHSPEYAERVSADPETWRLSWLPERKLNRDQAYAGMELDELISDLTAAHDRLTHAQINALADTIGIVWEQAIIRLYKRMLERFDTDDAEEGVPRPPLTRPRATQLFGHGGTRRVNYG